MDVMMQRLEKYASSLEVLVKQRKEQLRHEKGKSDKLLYRLLPKYGICFDSLLISSSLLSMLPTLPNVDK